MFFATYIRERKTEECTVRKEILEAEERCTHCGNTMNKGDTIYILCSEDEKIYRLDERCFQDYCQSISDVWSETDESVFQGILDNAVIAEANAILAEAKADSSIKNVQIPEGLDKFIFDVMNGN